MNARVPRIALVAGETSGDQLGAGLVAELRARHPGAEFAGVGGELDDGLSSPAKVNARVVIGWHGK